MKPKPLIYSFWNLPSTKLPLASIILPFINLFKWKCPSKTVPFVCIYRNPPGYTVVKLVD
jgi:hypothetical protein